MSHFVETAKTTCSKGAQICITPQTHIWNVQNRFNHPVCMYFNLYYCSGRISLSAFFWSSSVRLFFAPNYTKPQRSYTLHFSHIVFECHSLQALYFDLDLHGPYYLNARHPGDQEPIQLEIRMTFVYQTFDFWQPLGLMTF